VSDLDSDLWPLEVVKLERRVTGQGTPCGSASFSDGRYYDYMIFDGDDLCFFGERWSGDFFASQRFTFRSPKRAAALRTAIAAAKRSAA